MSDGIEALKMVYARLGSAIREIEIDLARCAEAEKRLAKVRQELAATLECDCGTCLACRVADVVGV